MRIKTYSKDKVEIINREWQRAAVFIAFPLIAIILEWQYPAQKTLDEGIPVIPLIFAMGAIVIGLLLYRNVTVQLSAKRKELKWIERTLFNHQIINVPFENIEDIELAINRQNPYILIKHLGPEENLLLRCENGRKLAKKVKIGLDTFLMRNR